jgi:hypothetical protein
MADVKLYRVTIEASAWVVAKSARDAENIISHEPEVLDDVRDNADVRAKPVDASMVRNLAAVVDGDTLPWRARGVSDDDADGVTVAEWARRAGVTL